MTKNKKNNIFWNDFYSHNEHQNFEPSETLIRFINSYNKKDIGTVLDLSSGNGRHTSWLKKQKIKTISSEINNKLLKNIKNKKDYKIILDLENEQTFENILNFNLKTIVAISTFYHVNRNNLSRFIQFAVKHCSLKFMFCNFISIHDEMFQSKKKVNLKNNGWVYTNNAKKNKLGSELNLFSYSIKDIKKIFRKFRKIHIFYESVPVNFHLRKAPNQKKLIWVLAIN